MSFWNVGKGSYAGCLLTGLLLVALVLLMTGTSRRAHAQTAKITQGQTTVGTDVVSRGRYIVEDVAMCGTCHTPRRADGSLDLSRWLAGAPVPYLAARPTQDWPIMAPRLAGSPPATNAGMVTLLTTGIWITGQPLRDPMPHFHMTRSDAEAVVAYLRSLTYGQKPQ
jgi:mono/diheme cytochrome c family protein